MRDDEGSERVDPSDCQQLPSTDVRWHLGDAFGVEMEYMIVDQDRLTVLPIADRLLHAVAGSYASEVELDTLSWSNELVRHVVELKTPEPVHAWDGLAEAFSDHVRRINQLLAQWNAQLLPTGMHPWMDPATETQLWPHEFRTVYETYDRIFNCRRHGWANLQSVHLNLSFAGDAEFARLHAAIRLILPIIPALAASTPVADGRITGQLDTRMEVYRTNAERVPSLAGQIVPEAVFSQREYQQQIFQPMYAAIEPLDPEGVLRHQFLNSRGAIARFDRGSIEIRVIDSQECSAADLAVSAAIRTATHALTQERWTPLETQQQFTTEQLSSLFCAVTHDADQTVIKDAAFLAQFGLRQASCAAGELWRHLLAQLGAEIAMLPPALRNPLDVIQQQGPLAHRLLRRLAAHPDRQQLREIYGALAACLANNTSFIA